MSALFETIFGTPSSGPTAEELQAKEDAEVRRKNLASRAGAQRERGRSGVGSLVTSPTQTGLSIPGTGGS